MTILMEWLEPSIEKGIDKTFDSFVENDMYNEVKKKIKDVLSEHNEDFGSKYIELEGLFLSALSMSVEFSYRSGLVDTMNIYSILKK